MKRKIFLPLIRKIVKTVTSVNYTAFKAIFICLLFIVISSSSFAAKKYSLGSGNWTTGGTWVGGIAPIANDTVIIQNTHSVSISSNLYSNSTYMFLIILGTLDLTNNGKLSFSATSKVIIETGARILGNSGSDQISIGTGSAEYTGSSGNITGPSYVSNGHTPVSGEGTAGCGCYTSVGSCTITSSNGYKVHIFVVARNIVVNTPAPCNPGYNYDVRLDYNITFSGTNIPASLYTLQGTVYCGSSALFFDLPNNGGSGSVTTGGNAWRNMTDCATSTPQSLSCLNATIQVEGPGIPGGTTCSSSLPIKLLRFEAVSTIQGAQLLWTTSTERNFDYFQIESAQQDLVFSSIAKIKGKGGFDINTSYTYLDKQVKSAKNYYRLKSVDLDGSFEYSSVVFVNWDNGSNIKLYPNPLTDHNFTIELNDSFNTPTEMRLLDQVGHLVYQSKLIQSTSEIHLPNSIQPGLYYLRIFSGQHQEMIKVVIQ